MNATGAPPPSIDGLVRLSRVPAHVGRIDKRPGELVSLRACKSDELKKKKMAKERGRGEMRVAASIMARPRNRATLAHKVISTPTLRTLSAMSSTRSELSLSYSLLVIIAAWIHSSQRSPAHHCQCPSCALQYVQSMGLLTVLATVSQNNICARCISSPQSSELHLVFLHFKWWTHCHDI